MLRTLEFIHFSFETDVLSFCVCTHVFRCSSKGSRLLFILTNLKRDPRIILSSEIIFIFVSIVYTNNCLGFLSTKEFPFTPRSHHNQGGLFWLKIIHSNEDNKKKKKTKAFSYLYVLRCVVHRTCCTSFDSFIRKGCHIKGEWIHSKHFRNSWIVNFNNGFKSSDTINT